MLSVAWTMLRIKLQMKGRGPGSIHSIASDATEADLAALAASAFSLPSVRLFTGFPPRPFALPLTDGTLIEVREPPPNPFELARFVVPADNSCLFHSVGFLLHGGPLGARAAELRAEAAREVLASPDVWTEAVLGRPPAEYAAYLSRASTWGGGLELSILAMKHRVEIVAVEVRSGVAYKFGEGAGFDTRAFLVYDGLHYDALVSARGSGVGAARAERLLPASEEGYAEAALALAARARAAHQYTDTVGFSLRCGACGVGVVGQAEAVAHAEGTGHTNFVEFK